MALVNLTRDSTYHRREGDGQPVVKLFPRPDLSIGLARKVDQEDSAHHTHDFMEIAIVERGHGIQAYDDDQFEISRGDVFVIHPHSPHSLRETQHLDLSNVLYIDDGSIPLLSDLSHRPGYHAMSALEPNLRNDDDPQRRLRLDSGQLEDVIKLVIRLETALFSDEPTASAVATIHFLELINSLCEAYESISAPGGRVLTQVSRAISFIEANFRDDFRIEDVAKEAHMSLRSFQRHFRETLGVSPARYILKRRIDEACRLLETTDTSMSEAAFEAGFRDPTYFSRAFRKEVGISPKRYQQESRA